MKWVIVAGVLLLLACQPSGVVESNRQRFGVTNTHSQDSNLTIWELPSHTRIDVRSDFGIGSSQIRLLYGDWPDDLRLRLYLKGLEGLSLTSNSHTWSKDSFVIMQSDDALFYQIQLPAEKLGDVLEIQWVDFYR